MSDETAGNLVASAGADQEEVFALLGASATHCLNGPVPRIDTHGAVVFLAGDDVYKVKRAVRFPFMDFSTLELRRAACAREVEINKTAAPNLYLGLIPITRQEGRLRLSGDGEAVEWAVHMRRFDENMVFDRIADRGELRRERLMALAVAVAGSHAQAAVCAEIDSAAELEQVLADNIAGLCEMPGFFAPAEVEEFGSLARQVLAGLRPLLAERVSAGEVRRCHGDLHLRNIVEMEGRVVLFDALEFSERLAITDRLYDLAFLLMDLGVRGLHFEANVVFNRYLVECHEGEPLSGLPALPLFIALRAAIRAQVTAAAVNHRSGSEVEGDEGSKPAHYFHYAIESLRRSSPGLIAIGGLSGTGKSTLAARLAPALGPRPGAVHLRSDVLRKRLLGAPEFERLPAAGYGLAVTDDVYERLRLEARGILAGGHAVVVDAVHQRPDEREALASVAAELDVEFVGLWLEAPPEDMTRRVEERRGDASDASGDVVREQAKRDNGPLDGWMRIDSSGTPDEVLERACAALLSGPSGRLFRFDEMAGGRV